MDWTSDLYGCGSLQAPLRRFTCQQTLGVMMHDVTLSQRLWWSVAHNTNPDDPAECMVWAKVRMQCRGKRHALRTIQLTDDEHDALIDILQNPGDDLFRFYIWHEIENYPDGWFRCLRWLPDKATLDTYAPLHLRNTGTLALSVLL